MSEQAHLEVTHFVPECHDQGEAGPAPVNGESNFLPEGTPIHRVDGFEPDERLAYFDSRAEAWRVLFPLTT